MSVLARLPFSILLAAALVGGCSDKHYTGDDTVLPCDTGCEGPVDGDGDGYPIEEDCDDADAMINPGADEDCDGLDNNCDGVIDEGVTQTYYQDEDGDGFGTAESAVEWCEPTTDVVENDGDCDDGDPYIYPGATEICDSVDNDCDDLIDEDLGETLYTDEDGDSYGDPSSAVTACPGSPGVVSDATDCDDTDLGVNPGASEICGDGIDQNCDDADISCTRLEGEISADDATAELMGGAGEYAGARVRPAGDVDGDGDDDLWVNLYGWGPARPDWHGSIMLVQGPITGKVALADVESANLYGAAATEYAGWDFSRGEDLDGDGLPDVAIGAYGHSDPSGVYGAGYVVYGPFAGDTPLASADGLIIPDDSNLSNLGYELSSSPDLTGDGIGDVVLGSYGSSTDSFAGAAWIVAGPVDGTLTLADGIKISGSHPVDLAGNGLDGVGDVDGDGVADLVVGAHADDTAGDAAGSAGLFLGPLSGDATMADADLTFTGEYAADEFSRNAVNGRGDVDGDGYSDVFVGAFFASPSGSYSGAAFLFCVAPGTTGFVSASDATARFYGASTNDFFGRSLDIGGDMDADGFSDVLVGGQGIDGPGGADAGVAALYYGPVSGSFAISDADALFQGSAANDGLGISSSTAGDTNGDGRDDILVGAWFNDDNGDYAGAAYLFAGG